MSISNEPSLADRVGLPRLRAEALEGQREATEFFQAIQGAVRWASEITAAEAVRSDAQLSSDSQRRNLMSIVTHSCTASFQDHEQKIQRAWR